MTYALHPLCETLPDMPADQFSRLVEDIRANGLRHPIVLFEGKILDGRHRYRACTDAGVDPRYEQYTGQDALAFVLSENLARRHLSESQRAMVAAKIANLNKGQTVRSANWPISPVSQEAAGRLLNVSDRSLRRATDVKRHGVRALVEKVEAGSITLNEANRIATLGPAAQSRIVAIEDKRQRQHQLTTAISRSQASKPKQPRTEFMPKVTSSLLVRDSLARLEQFSHNVLAEGLTPEAFVDRFLAEIDWNQPRMPQQLAICTRATAAIAALHDVLKDRAPA